ncbi:hypothetical protein [Corynebacterium sp.]|uniref:hypothetical protein n=1 Tax=Corynebacterium sp. TaxID=1720 RepID=UPI0026DAA4B2|nr:hypothetical protein [Corynebacterium sp.]MDO5077323.1 hypothetical protein [Corynebacterium sp.]
MVAPKPQDPRVSPESVRQRVSEVLGRPSETLEQEAALLAEAHDIAQDALK